MSKEKKYSRRAFAKAAGGWVAAAAVANACVPDSPQPDGVTADGLPTDGREGSSEPPVETTAREAPPEPRSPELQGRDGSGGIEPSQESAPEPREPISDASTRPDESFPEPQPEPRPEPSAPDVKPPDLSGRKYVAVDLNKHPDMKKIGWYIDVTLPSDSVNLFRRSATTFAAISMTCTHNGCFVWWRARSQFFQCPCHAATFDRDGRVTGGPAPTDLRTYPTGFDAKANIAYIFLDR